MSKTAFTTSPDPTPSVGAAFLNTIYGTGTSGGHRHNAVDADGSVDKIDFPNEIKNMPWVDVRAYASLSAARTAIGSVNPTALFIPDPHTVSSDLSMYANIHVIITPSGSITTATASTDLVFDGALTVQPGGTLTVGSGTTLTMNGSFDAGVFGVFGGSGAVSFGAGSVDYARPEWFGALADGSDDGAAINSAIWALTGGGTVFFMPGRTYSVNPGSNRIRIKSNITLDLQGSTIQRIGTNYVNNIVENHSYTQPAADFNITVKNGTIKGNAINTSTQNVVLSPTAYTAFVGGDIGKTLLGSTGGSGIIDAYNNGTYTVTVQGSENFSGTLTTSSGVGGGTFVSSNNTQSHASPAGNIFFYGVDGFVIENMKFDTANGDCLGWRQSSNGLVSNCVGGSFGRNQFSPCSGENNRIINCNFEFRGLTGASPGEYIDMESDGDYGLPERSRTYWDNVRSYGITLYDPFTKVSFKLLTVSSFSTLPDEDDDPGKILVETVSGATATVLWISKDPNLIGVEPISGTLVGGAFTITGGTGAGTISAVSAPEQRFSHEAQFINCDFVGGSPQTFRAIAAEPASAKNFVIGDSCSIAVIDSGASALSLGNVNGIRCNAKLINNYGSIGTTRGIELAAAVSDLIFKGSISKGNQAFANGIVAASYPLTASLLDGVDLGNSNIYVGSDSNRFIGCSFSTMILSDSDSNFFDGCSIATLSVNGSSNDFTSCTIGGVTVDGAGSVANRFRIDTRITGSKSFTNSATWLGQIFEWEVGNFSPSITGSSGGGPATLTVAWGKYNILGDICYFSMSATWSTAGGTGYQKVNLNLPHSIVPVDAVTPSRWAVSVLGYNFAFTGSSLLASMTGGNDFLVVYGLSNTGTATAVPASITSGTYESITGFFRVR